MPIKIRDAILKQKKELESQLVDSESFIQDLRSKIVNSVENKKISRQDKQESKGSLFNYLFKPNFRYVFALSLLIMMGLGLYLFFNPASRPTMTVAYAMDRIKSSYDQLINTDSIFHQKTVMKWYEHTYENAINEKQNDIVYEVWEDMSSNRIRNIVDYGNGHVVYQIDDGEKYWDYDLKTNTVVIETYIYEKPDTANNKMGERVIQSLSTYQTLFGLDESELVLSEESVEGEIYQVLSTRTQEDINATLELKPETDYNKYYFDKDEFLLRRERYYIVSKSGETLAQETVILEIEGLERTEQRMADLFVFDITLPADVEYIEKEVYIGESGNNYENPDQVYPDINTNDEVYELPNPQEQTSGYQDLINEINQTGFYANEEYKIVIPKDWLVINLMMADADQNEVRGIVIEKNGYYFDIVSDALYTGGGWGLPYDGVCFGNHQSSADTQIANTNLARVDEIMSMDPADRNEDMGGDWCTLTELHLSETQVSPFWTGSIIKIATSSEPTISRSKMFGEQYDYDSEYISIKYGFDYWNYSGLADRVFPSQNDQELLQMLTELDKITSSITFYE